MPGYVPRARVDRAGEEMPSNWWGVPPGQTYLNWHNRHEPNEVADVFLPDTQADCLVVEDSSKPPKVSRGPDPMPRRGGLSRRRRRPRVSVGRILVAAALCATTWAASSGIVRRTVFDVLFQPCQWHEAIMTGMGATGAAYTYVNVFYVWGGVADSVPVSDYLAARIKPGVHVWVSQCQHGLGIVKDDAIDMGRQDEGPDRPQASND